jgi:hypothetical protein
MRPEIKLAIADLVRRTSKGAVMGQMLVKIAEPEIDQLIAKGEPDDRCATCAFRSGTAPNQCEQTMFDAIKCVLEGHPFYCHDQTIGTGSQVQPQICQGYYAARQRAKDCNNIVAPWDFSPPD